LEKEGFVLLRDEKKIAKLMRRKERKKKGNGTSLKRGGKQNVPRRRDTGVTSTRWGTEGRKSSPKM